MHIDPTHSSTLLLPRNGPPPSGPFLLASPADCGGLCVPTGSPPSDPTLARHPSLCDLSTAGATGCQRFRAGVAACEIRCEKCDEHHRKAVRGGALCGRPEAQQYPPPLKAARSPSGPLFLSRLRRRCALVAFVAKGEGLRRRSQRMCADSRSRIAARTRSAICSPVKPTSACSSAGLPWVT